jgi:hypothetical protein
MKLARSSLCGLLLEDGEEDLAVLIARAALPDVLDSETDAPALAAIGLSEEELLSLLPAIRADPDKAAEAVQAAEQSARVTQTLSARWAHLVTVWSDAAKGSGQGETAA